MKTKKKYITFIAVLILLMTSIFTETAFAAATASISGGGNYKVGHMVESLMELQRQLLDTTRRFCSSKAVQRRYITEPQGSQLSALFQEEAAHWAAH